MEKLMYKMSKLTIVAVITATTLAYAVDQAVSQPPDTLRRMYLCIDQKKPQTKLVYGYINGQKTECMPESQLLALFDKPLLDSLRTLQENANRTVQPAVADSDIVEAIRHGKKDIAGVDLSERDLMGIDCTGANLKGGRLGSADLRNAVFRSANCENADFTAAYMKKANLSNANLKGAQFKNAYLAGANLTGAQGLSAASFKDVRTLCNAKLDPPLLAMIKEEYPEKLQTPKKCWEDNSWAPGVDCDEGKQNYPINVGNN
jgi:hypothetical protein